jgi:hypothetical protein
LQLDRLRRRPLDLLLDPADDLLHRPQQAAGGPPRFEDLADEEGGGRLAVGPGHPDHLQLAARLAPEARRQRRHRRPGAGHHQLRRRHLELALDDQRRRPVGHRPRPELVAVDPLPRHAEEQRPGVDFATVVGKRRHLDGGVAEDPGGLNRAGKLVKPHLPAV